jgi:hypothetical protein
MRATSVVRGNPSFAAAPPRPPTTQLTFLQRFCNVNAFQFLQSSFGCSGRHRREVREFLRLRAQHRTVRHQHGAFDEVLQFANIARPVVTLLPRNDRRTVHSRRDCQRTWSALLWRAIGTRENLAARTCATPRHRFLSARPTVGDGVGSAHSLSYAAARCRTGGAFLPQQRLYFSPEPQGQRALRGTAGASLQNEAGDP